MKKIVTAVLTAVLTLAFGVSVFAADGNSNTSFKIEYDTSTAMHYIPAEIAKQENADGRFLIYCMNNRLAWPHTTTAHPTIPNYSEGYLTEKDFESTSKYNEFMSRLQTILYAGYPYNGFGLYQIVDNPKEISEAEFNELLVAPEDVRSDFKDILGDTQFTYSDYTNNNTENLNKLSQFYSKVLMMSFTSEKTTSGLSYQDISSLPFYKAAFCMVSASSSQTPIQLYAQNYPDSYYVTKSQAYEATQAAVWRLMTEYSIPNNNITDTSDYYKNNPLAKVLYDVSDANDEILRSEPSSDKVSISGDTTLTYDKSEKKWVSGELSVTEPDNYHGIYTLSVTGDGVQVETASGGTTVKAGETFRLVSDKQTTGKVTATADSMVWLKSMKMYSPIDSEEFQHMVGVVIGTKTISTAKAFNSTAKPEESTTTDPKDPENNKPTDPSKPTTENSSNSTTKTTSKPTTQTAPAQQKIEGKSMTAVLTGDDSNWTKYADWLVLAALVGTAAVVIKKKTQA
jgi:hypothetical protein